MTGLDNPVAVGSTALMSAVAIQALKNSNWASWFNRNTPHANLALSIVVALATATGIHFTMDWTTGNGNVAFNLHGLWEAVVQWVTQHAIYKKMVAEPEAAGEIRALLQRLLPPPISEPERKTEIANPGTIGGTK